MEKEGRERSCRAGIVAAMNPADVVILAQKSCAIDRWLRGHSTDEQFREEFSRFDPPPAWADTPGRFLLGAMLLAALLVEALVLL